jgi:hypothetical protein
MNETLRVKIFLTTTANVNFLKLIVSMLIVFYYMIENPNSRPNHYFFLWMEAFVRKNINIQL